MEIPHIILNGFGMNNYISRQAKTLSLKQCQDIIDFFNTKETEWHEERQYNRYNASIQELPDLYERLTTHLNSYSHEHPFLKGMPYLWGPTLRFNIQKYLPGESFWKEHMEHGLGGEYSTRILAWMIYLNDIKHKGGTCWPQQKFTSKPRAGDSYIWPAAWTHTHYGIAAPKEIKYIATGWVNIVDIRK